MIVMFQGGGPAAGLYKDFPRDKREIRVATEQMLADGKAALYVIVDVHQISGLRKWGAVASFVGMRDSAASLVDMAVQEGQT